MRRTFALLSTSAVVLLFLVAVQGARITDRVVDARVVLGGHASNGLEASTRRVLEDLPGRIEIDDFVSDPSVMPARMKGIEAEVRSLLERLHQAAPERVDYRVIDPDVDPEGARYASSKGVAPSKVEKVLHDESSEKSVWSTLVIGEEAGAQRIPDVRIEVGPDDVPYLERLIVSNLEAAARPIQPVVAIAAPKYGYARIAQLVPALCGARVVTVDFDHDPWLPPEADLLIWIDPHAGGAAQAAALERFVSSGRSAIVAGSTYAIDYVRKDDGAITYRARPSSCDWQALLRPFGVRLEPLLLLDQRHESIAWRSRPGAEPIAVDAPFHLWLPASLMDTKGLLGPNSGSLLAPATSPAVIDEAALARAGRHAEIVATTSDHARVLELPDGDFDAADCEAARPVPKQPWLLRIEGSDAWQGTLVLAGSAGLFRDEVFEQGHNGNEVFLRTLLRTFTDPPRLARLRVQRFEPAAVPPLSLAARTAWRGITVFLVPALVLGWALRRGRMRAPRRRRWSLASAGVALFVVVLLVASAWRSVWDPRLDLTADGTNTASPLTRRLLAASAEPLQTELVLSDGTHMPVALKGLEHRLVRELRTLGLAPRLVRPEELPPPEQARLREAGIEPFEVETVENDATVTTPVWSAIRLRLGERSEVLPRIDQRSARHLEFLLAAAARRLRGEPAPRVGVLSDLPRLSPAEAFEFQQNGQTAPEGTDVYSVAKRLLKDYGYETIYIDPDAPVLPAGMDVLVWLQPRLSKKVLPQFGAYLASGGHALVALQHYNVQQRQYRGGGFATVYWPQPQWHGLNDYLELIGVQQLGENFGKEHPGEVLLDRQHADLVLDTQVKRSAWRENEAQQVARPFLIRAAGDGISRRSPITSRLGSLLFAWGSRFSFDDDVLQRNGIARTVLVTTSPRCWTYAWSGGWIPEEAFDEPEQLLPGPQPLAVLLEGRFPAVRIVKGDSGRDELAPQPDAPPSRDGKLLLIGCSEMFKDASLTLPGYQHDQLLLNAVAYLAYGPELAEIQARTRVPRAVAYQPAGVKIAWRTLVLAVPVVLFLLYGLGHRAWRRRPVRGVRS